MLNKEEVEKTINNMSEQELNDYIFFCLKEADKQIIKLKKQIKQLKNEVKELEEIAQNESEEKKMKVKDKIVALIPKKQDNIQEIKVPDLKQYLVSGYEEIREVKKQNSILEKELEEQKKNELLYKATLVTLNEFRKRDEENKSEIEGLKNKIIDKNEEINNINNELNTYKIREQEVEVKKIQIEKEIENAEYCAREELKKNLKNKVKETKGNLSKDKVVKIIDLIN